MKFLVDAQLPRRLAREIVALRHDARHTLSLPGRNSTGDYEGMEVARAEGRILITKDNDFVESFLLRGDPPQLLLLTTGNITNSALVQLLRANWSTVVSLFALGDFVELSRTSVRLRQ